MINIDTNSYTYKYLNAISSVNCDFRSVAAKVTILAFPIIILITLLFDWVSNHFYKIVEETPNLPIPEYKLIQQRDLIHRSIKHLNEHPDHTMAHRDALAFFKEGLQKNEQREWVKLPNFFHATADEKKLKSILKAKTIFQNKAYRGYGAFVSTADEAGQILGYGRYTFAIDGETLKFKPGAFFIPNPENGFWDVLRNRLAGWQAPSIWIRVESHIPVNPNSIAYIGYPPEEEQANRDERAEIKRSYPWIRWMNRKTSEKICEVFRAVTTLDLPRQWRWMENETHYPLPQHIRQIA